MFRLIIYIVIGYLAWKEIIPVRKWYCKAIGSYKTQKVLVKIKILKLLEPIIKRLE